jgi:hypothetical protein
MRKNSKFQIPNSRFFGLSFGFWNRVKTALFVFFFLFSIDFFAQHLLPLADDRAIERDRVMNDVQMPGLHSAIKPFLDKDAHGQIDYRDTSRDNAQLWNAPYPHRPRKDGVKLPAQKPFLIRPIYDVKAGQDLPGDRFLFTTAGGIIFDADYDKQIGLELRFASGISVLPEYSDSIARFSGTMPGWGDRAYPMGNGKYAFQHFSGNLIWRPSKVFNFQVGRDKHFWGDGYRSLFLSDAGSAFPYAKMQTTIWKLQYTSLFAWLQDWTNSFSNGGNAAQNFRSKFATFHYLSFNAAKWLNLGVFESVVWQGTDNNRTRWFDPNYFDPIVFFRPVEYSLGSSDNAMLGLALKIRFNRNNYFYSQIILDEFYLKEIKNWSEGWWANKQGVQIGYKCFNFALVQNLFMQTEVNIVRPYTYSHGSPQQSYTHGGMPLAHPMGANFAEMIGILSYNWSGLTITGKLVGIRYGMDPAGQNFGQNIFLSYITRSPVDPNAPLQVDFGHKLFDGIATNVFYAEFKTSYRFNTKFPLRVELTAAARSETFLSEKKKSSWIMAGLALPLWRSYHDY